MAGRRTNVALFGLLLVAFGTGSAAYAVGTGWNRWLTIAHGVAGLAVVLLTPWKSVVVRRGLRRGRAGAAASAAFGVLVTASVATGLTHALGVRDLGAFTSMQVHVGAALAAVPLGVWHVVARPAGVRRSDLSRRTFLRSAALAAGAGAAWLVVQAVGERRRFTGSHEVGSFRPGDMPVTQWLDDDVPRIDPARWSVRMRDVKGERRLRLGDLEAPEAARDRWRATLDCTGGWFAHQDWEGVPLVRIVEPGDARSLVVRSATGYERRFPVRDLPHLLLATRVGGAPLSPGHGFPARIVAPGRRGFWWVKWVVEIRTSDRPWWWQSPFPLT